MRLAKNHALHKNGREITGESLVALCKHSLHRTNRIADSERRCDDANRPMGGIERTEHRNDRTDEDDRKEGTTGRVAERRKLGMNWNFWKDGIEAPFK